MIRLTIRYFFGVVVWVSFGLAGCSSTADRKPVPPERSDDEYEGVVLKFDKSGKLVPYTKDGLPFVLCSDREKNCRLFRDATTITELEPITILKVQHINSKPCEYFIFYINNTKHVYADPTNPNCSNGQQ